VSGLPPFELGYPRTELRRKLFEALLRGEKTTTTGLLEDYEADGEDVDRPGDRYALLDYDDQTIAIVEVIEARVLPAAAIDEQFARDEGEGFESVEEWRLAHERFFERPIGPDTQVVAVRFRVVERVER